jgi:hypothetical protein
MSLNLFLLVLKVSDFVSKEAENRGKSMDAFLESMSKSKICDTCPSVKHSKRGGYDNPCEKGHYSSTDLGTCEDHPDPKYHPKK